MIELITGDIWKQANKFCKSSKKRRAAIAYITSTELLLTKGDLLICDASNNSIMMGETSAETLNYYFKKGVEIFINKNLHAKVLLMDEWVVVGSSNLSQNSAKYLSEAAIICNDKTLLSQIRAFLYTLEKESQPLTKSKLKELLKIKVIKRPRKPLSGKRVKTRTFGNKIWYTLSSPLSDRIDKQIEPKVEKKKAIILEQKGIDHDDVGVFRTRRDSAFGKNAKAGDQIIFKFKDGSRTKLFPPSTILDIERDGDYNLYYHLEDKEAISWSRFNDQARKIKFDKFANRTKQIESKDVEQIAHFWNNRK